MRSRSIRGLHSDACVRLLAVGDIMLGDHPVCIGHGVRSKIEREGPDHPFRFVSHLLQDADITFGNLEAVLSDSGYDKDDLTKAELRGKTVYAQMLSRAGFSVLSIANNHIMQHGDRAFWDTAKALADQGIFPSGLRAPGGESNVFVFEKENIRIALVSYSLRPEKYSSRTIPYARANEAILIRQIRQLSSLHDVVVVSLHWGEEYMNLPSPAQIHLANRLLHEGAKLILGHHPHVLQGLTMLPNVAVAFSLGNFVFDKWQRNTRQSIILDCMIKKQGVQSVSWIPILINREFQPVPATGHIKNKICSNILSYSQAITSASSQGFAAQHLLYQKKARRAYLHFRISSYLYFLTHLHLYSFRMISQSLARAVKRRIGKL